jgi:hypothetical protein
MTTPVILGLLWLVAANVIGMFPSKRGHWPAAYGLIAVGIPLLGWITYHAGPWIGLAFFAAGASILRWPLRFMVRWLQGSVSPREEG